MRRLVLVVSLASGLAACRAKSDGAPCGSVAARFFMLAQGDLGKATLDPTTRRMVLEQLPAMRDSLAQACDDGNWSAAARDCLAKADTHAAFVACEQQLTDDQRAALDRSARGETEKR